MFALLMKVILPKLVALAIAAMLSALAPHARPGQTVLIQVQCMHVHGWHCEAEARQS